MIANRRVLRHAVLVASDGGEVEYRRQVALRGFLNCLICDRKLIRRHRFDEKEKRRRFQVVCSGVAAPAR